MAEIEHVGPVQGFVSQEATLAPKQGIFESSDVARCPLGTRIRVGPRVFYYAHFCYDTNRGLLVAPDTSANDLTEFDGAFISGNYGFVAGIKLLQCTGTATLHQFAGGFLHITDDTGEGYCYGIKDNSKTGEKLHERDPDAYSSSEFIIELYDPLVEALATDADAYISGNMYKNLRLATAATDMCVAGLSMITMDVSVAPYAWVQTWGPATCLCDGTPAKGDILTLSDTTTTANFGGAQIQAAYTELIIGHALEAGDACLAHFAVYLQIAP